MMTNQKYMFFIDGTNFLIELGKELNLKIIAEKPPKNAFRIAELIINDICHHINPELIIRRYWFGSYLGNEEDGKLIRRNLWEKKFEPIIIKKKQGREKGVDISLTKEMLVNAFNKNFDVAFLIAGDEDYLSLINEAKRYGGKIYGAFFNHGLSEDLKLAFDSFRIISSHGLIKNQWNEITQAIDEEIKMTNKI